MVVVVGLGFWKEEGELSLGLRGLERFVGMVRDIVGTGRGERVGRKRAECVEVRNWFLDSLCGQWIGIGG